MIQSLELRKQRATLINQANEILNAADAAKRAMSGEEQSQYDKIMVDVDALKGTIDRVERQATLNSEMADQPHQERGVTSDEEKRDAFRAWLRDPATMSPDQRSVLAESRAQSVTTTGGGYIVPQGFGGYITDAMKFFGGMRQAKTTKLNTAMGNDLPMPSCNDTAQVGELLAINTGAASQDLTFGQIVMKAYKYSSKIVLVPWELLQDSGVDIEAYIGKKLGERIGRIQNTHFTTGDSSGKPQGIVAGATLGKTGASGQVASIIVDDLIDLVHSVDPAYRAGGNCQFMFADSTLKALKKLKDSTGRQLWQAGLAVKEPDTIDGYGYIINNDVAAMEASAKSVIFGDLSTYLIRDVMDLSVYRVTDKYIESGQVGFIAFQRSDGRCIDAGTHPISYYANAAS